MPRRQARDAKKSHVAVSQVGRELLYGTMMRPLFTKLADLEKLADSNLKTSETALNTYMKKPSKERRTERANKLKSNYTIEQGAKISVALFKRVIQEFREVPPPNFSADQVEICTRQLEWVLEKLSIKEPISAHSEIGDFPYGQGWEPFQECFLRYSSFGIKWEARIIDALYAKYVKGESEGGLSVLTRLTDSCSVLRTKVMSKAALELKRSVYETLNDARKLIQNPPTKWMEEKEAIEARLHGWDQEHELEEGKLSVDSNWLAERQALVKPQRHDSRALERINEALKERCQKITAEALAKVEHLTSEFDQAESRDDNSLVPSSSSASLCHIPVSRRLACYRLA
ncbi:hypothetical protein JCM5350_007976 [Sporobolomyces pararoseus]